MEPDRQAAGTRHGSRRGPRWLALCLVALLMAGCGGDAPASQENESAEPSPTTSAPTPEEESVERQRLAERCGDGPRSARPEAVDSPTGESLYAVTAGSGRNAVVLVHGSGSSGICVWTRELAWLPDAGFQVWGYDAACVGNSTCRGDELRPIDDLAAVVGAARAGGADQVVVLAASAGGYQAVEIAAQPDAGVDATVALSPAGEVPASLREDASDAQVPVLYALARDDEFGSVADVRRLHKLSAPAGATLRILPDGAGHAQETLYAPGSEQASAFRAELIDFLTDPRG